MKGNRLKTSNTGRSEFSIRVKLITLINFKKYLTKTQITDEKIKRDHSQSVLPIKAQSSRKSSTKCVQNATA